MSSLLEARHLTRHYGAHVAVQDLSFCLEAGEVVGLLGPNGAGKSTSLGMLTGVLAPSSGSVHIQGLDLAQEPLRAKALLGYLPEHPPLYLNLRVDEYLEYCGRLRCIPSRKLAEAVAEARARCGLETVGRRLVGQLSRGYRQRLGIAQAILHRPALIVLDEPTVGLDPAQSQAIRDLIRDLGRERGVLLSTHLLTEAQVLCQRVLFLRRGRWVGEARLAGGDTLTGGRLRIVLARPPGPEALAGLPGITSVVPLCAATFHLELAPGADPALVAEALVAGGWGLRELTPERPSLEQLFLDLTTGAKPVEAAP